LTLFPYTTLFRSDPGKAYINGFRVETGEYSTSVAKGIATSNNPAARIRLGYGNYVRVKELAGNFDFNKGAKVDLQGTPATYVTTGAPAGSAISAPGTKLGEARIRSVTLETGEVGTPNAVYRLYLFDVVMEGGKNFGDVRSIYYGGTNKGIADVILSASGAAILEDSTGTSLLYSSVPAMRSAERITYTYRTINDADHSHGKQHHHNLNGCDHSQHRHQFAQDGTRQTRLHQVPVTQQHCVAHST
jgi:hypothetical protein